MPRAHANGIDLEWEEFGNADDPPLLMIPGMGHDLPREAWETIVDAVVELVATTRELV